MDKTDKTGKKGHTDKTDKIEKDDTMNGEQAEVKEVKKETEAQAEAESKAETTADVKAEDANEAKPEGPTEESTPCVEPDELSRLRCELDKAKKERDEYLEYAKRMKADFENYKRRNTADSLEQYDNGRARIIEDSLPIMDNIERALEFAQDEGTRQGVGLVLKQLVDLHAKWGVSVINRVGEPFDPALENAVMRGEAGEGKSGAVLQVLQKGYKLGSRVIRFAMVKVAD